MLTPDMDRYASENKFGQDSIYSALGILRSIQNVAERTVILDATRSDLVTAGTYTNDSVGNIMEFNNPQDGSSALLNVADFYHVVNSCNFYLANVDTTISQNNTNIMQREWAQVQSMRAWAYIQLVRFYGEVPFVTKPISSTNEAEHQAKTAPKVTASNLASLLAENGLVRAYELQRQVGIPDYESFSNGTETFSSKLNFFPVQLVLADAYLMGHDYANAASYYYDYFINQSGNIMPAFNNNRINGRAHNNNNAAEPQVSSGDLLNAFSTTNDIITMATGAANSSYGKVLNQIQNIYGFETTVKGTTNVTPNEQYQQVLPSNQYVSLNKAQRFNKFELDGEVRKITEAKSGDARLLAWTPEIEYRNGNSTRLITKFAPGRNDITENSRIRYNEFKMNYNIPLYRVPVVVLRYAEAVNRLGFPELAFGILKDGLISQNLPTYGTLNIVKDDSRIIKIVEADTTYNDTVPGIIVGKLANDGLSASADYSTDSTVVIYSDAALGTKYAGNFIPYVAHDSIPGMCVTDIPEEVANTWNDVEYLLDPKAMTGGMYHMSMAEAKDMQNYRFLDFTGSQWSVTSATENFENYGVHSRGAGDCAGTCDTVYTYARQVAEKVAEEYARANGLTYAEQQAYAKTLYDGDLLLVTDKAAIQNAVENIIVDELALETAFEGNRFCDLIRIAEHKNASGVNGTDWLAWKIARRNYNCTADAGSYDPVLKSKLTNKQNWYLSLPR